MPTGMLTACCWRVGGDTQTGGGTGMPLGTCAMPLSLSKGSQHSTLPSEVPEDGKGVCPLFAGVAAINLYNSNQCSALSRLYISTQAILHVHSTGT